MRPHLAGVLAQRLAPGRGIGRMGRGEERVERHLGVDHDLLAAGQRHHDVGPEHAVVGLLGHLLLERASRGQAGDLQAPAQLQLAPVPAHLGPAQRLGQGSRLAAQLLAAEVHRLDLLLELGLPGRARSLEVAEPIVEPVEGLADRPHHLLGGGDPRVGDREDLLARLGDCLGRQRAELVAQLVAGPLGDLDAGGQPEAQAESSVRRAMTKVVASMRRTMTATSDKTGPSGAFDGGLVPSYKRRNGIGSPPWPDRQPVA